MLRGKVLVFTLVVCLSAQAQSPASLIHLIGPLVVGQRPVEGNPVQERTWQGVPIPKEGSKEKPKLADSVFVGKSCRTRDKTVRKPEDVAKDDAERYYWLHPNFKTTVKPKGAKGVDIEVQQGPYTIKFAADDSSGAKKWSGDAQVKLDLSGSRFPEGAEKPPTDYKGPFQFEISEGADKKQVQTMLFMTSRRENSKVFLPPADFLEGITEEHYEKVSSDGNFISFTLVKDKTGKLVAYQVYGMCGDAFGSNKELSVSDDMHKMTPSIEKVFAALMGGSKSELPAVPPAPDLSGRSPADSRKALDKYMEDLESYKKKITQLRDKIGAD